MKRSLWRRLKVKLAIVGGAGVLLVSPDLGCISLGFSGLASSTNFCFLFNCNEGAIGGLIDFCGPTRFLSFVGGPQAAADSPLLADCPDEQP
ncbi:MAG: hypothetical protein HOP29_10715 [Phycisphaerales bacterium]|nr:hypothetical protein [Phycisphaerales bacterium]